MSLACKRQIKNFTLLEVLVVIAVIVILAGVLGGVLISMANRAKNEGAANQIKKVLAALEQFKQDFGMYPPSDEVDNGGVWATTTASLAAADWYKTNNLAWHLAKTLSGNATTLNRSNPYTWSGDYLTKEDIPSEQVSASNVSQHGEAGYFASFMTTVKPTILDLWGKPLAYCAPTYLFISKSVQKTLKAVVDLNADGYKDIADQATLIGKLKTPGTITYASPANTTFVAYRYAGNTSIFGGRSKTLHLPSLSYSLKNSWIDSELSQPEVWSYGQDDRVRLFHYNKSNTAIDETQDADNVGGSMNLMKIQ